MNPIKAALDDSFYEVPQGFDQAMQRAFAGICAPKQPEKTGRKRVVSARRTLLLAALIPLLLMTLAVATGLWGSIFQFSDRYLSQMEQQALPQARQLVTRNIASWQLEHVRIEIKEAIYDGQELRFVYALTDPSVTQLYQDNPEGTLDEMTGLEKDGVWEQMDAAYVNGQSISWDDEKLETSDIPGQVLVYKSSVLPLWGVEPPKGAFTVTLGLLKGKPLDQQPCFTMDASAAKAYLKSALPAVMQDGGLTVEVLGGLFTPLCATLDMRITLPGDETYADASRWLEGSNLFLADGTAISGSRHGLNPDSTVLETTLVFRPPAESHGWGESVFLRPLGDNGAPAPFGLEISLQ